ncbi:MAG TPA: N-methyl-L-tryptophan oxidase [Phycisphaerae bacterium]
MSTAQNCSTVIVGGGVMGGAAALALARRGESVTLLERFAIGHDLGSSHGYSRIIRFAYFEHPDYVRLALAAAELWRRLERETGLPLMHTCGGLDIGPPEGLLVSGSKRSCDQAGLKHDYLTRSELERGFPQFRHVDEVAAVYQPDAGILAPTRCVIAQIDAARRLGARIVEGTCTMRITPAARDILIETPSGDYRAQRVIVSTGPWTAALLPDLRLPLKVVRKVVAFFEPSEPEAFSIERFPVFIYQTLRGFFYGFGRFGIDGVKVAEHTGGADVDPDRVDRNFTSEDEAPLRWFLSQHLPGANGRRLYHRVCLYTMTPDEDFVIDLHPRDPRIVIAGGFSGHGFKFGPIVGEILADLALTGRTQHPTTRFRITRFAT